nr:amino acid ABC transporter permease [bacterium]
MLIKSLMAGAKYTLGLFAITAVISLPLGLMLSFLRGSKSRVVRGLVSGYVWLMRGTPLMLQLCFFYYGLAFIPYIGPYLAMGRFPAACLTFILNYAAYFCEIFRGGLIAVDRGQYEAARVLGLSRWQTTWRIVVPQMLRVSLPPISNECITLVKDTALVVSIGVTDLLFFAKAAVNRDVNATAFVVAAAFYLLMTFGLTRLFGWLEKKLSY